MITIPTGDLVGIFSDVIPMACEDDDLPQINCVRLEWDGQLHAMATDRYRLAWSSWNPEDKPEKQHQPALDTEWGGGDGHWAVTIGLDDAKHLVKTYKLKGKDAYYVPLTVELGDDVITVTRSRVTGYTAITTVVPDRIEGFPDLRQVLSKHDVAVATTELALNAKYLADFAKVRPRGPLQMVLTGPKSLVHISIGDRFIGAIQPVVEGGRDE